MKKIVIISAALFFSAAMLMADDRHVDVNRLPNAAREFLNANFPGEKILYVTQEDDLILPDYDVALENGVMLEFYNNGALEKISSRSGVGTDLIPVQIVEFVKVRYPDAYFVEYKVERKHYEVTLSNRMELKFNRHFNLIKIDD